MPILKDFRQTKIVSLPSFPESKVEIYDSLLVGDIANLQMKKDQSLEDLINLLPKFIKSWNFTDDQGKVLEIIRENLNFLKQEDVVVLTGAITEFMAQTKKK